MAGNEHDKSLAHRTTEVASGDRSGARGRSVDSPPDWSPAFDADVVLGERYRVVRFLARGGMGEVYEAEDLVLHMRVALKSIARELVADAHTIEGLKREVLLARKVTHPNVCRLHDLGFHVSPEGTSAFLTMDLLRGDTLAAHVARKGRLSTSESLPIVRQLAAALEAAHEAGVIHRDFKARNVMLVPGTGSTPPRAVVMDFGIAFATEEEDQRALLDEGRIVGTPAYVAPEQVEGGAITRATDVYALGVVLFEMVTGGLPFEAERAIDVISMRLTKPPPSPRSRVKTLDLTWDAVILKCLARDPADRFQTVREVVAALEVHPAPVGRRRAAIGALAGIGIALAGFAWEHARSTSTGGEVHDADARRRPTLAIVVKDSSRADQAGEGTRWIGTALGNILGSELDADEALRVVPFDRVAQARRELALDDDVVASKGAIAKLHDSLGADYVIEATYVAGPGSAVEVSADVNASDGQRVARAASHGTTATLFDLAMPLAEAVRKRLGARDPSAAQVAAARAAISGNADAVKWYAEGRVKYSESDFAGALQAFGKAVAADPSFPLAHDGLASASNALGYDARAIEESKKAFDGSRALSREEQLAIEERYRAAAKDWPRATEIGRALVEFFPDNVEYGLRHAHSLVAAGRSKDALIEVERMHGLAPPERDDPRIDLYEAIASSKLSDFKRDLEAARRAAAKAQSIGATTVLADAHDLAGDALTFMHRPDEAIVDVEQAHALYVKLGDRAYEAGSLKKLANIYRERGDLAHAVPLAREALTRYRAIGSRYNVANSLTDLGSLRWLEGDETSARALFQEARGLYEAIHDREGIGNALAGLALVDWDEGHVGDARSELVLARTNLRAVDEHDGVTSTTLLLAELALVAGDRETAESEIADGEALAKDDVYSTASAKLVRARIALGRGDVGGAARAGQEALDAFRTTESAHDVLVAECFRARVALDDGHFADAEALARSASDAAHAGDMKNVEAIALAALASALVGQKKLDDASSALDGASALAPTRVEAQLVLAIARARLLSAQGRASQARALLAATAKRAASLSLDLVAKDARRALGRDD
jgi:tetratricopeptide (TPR) repeat protein